MMMPEHTQRTWAPLQSRDTTAAELKNHGDYSAATVRAPNRSLATGTQVGCTRELA
jgi:hypothetical protein